MSITRFPGGLLVGAGLMYFFDPARGRKRRARLAELVLHAQRVERVLVGKAARDAKQRMRGLGGKVRHALEDDVTDGVLQSRARAAIGRVVSHPGAIECEIDGGHAVLRGPILASEARDAIARVARIPGIHGVIDRLERHLSSDVPALQGGRTVRRQRETWPPSRQVGAIGSGLALALYGLVVKRGVLGTAVGAAGGALAVRGLVNRPLRELVEPSGEIVVQKTITVAAPIHMVFDLWTRPDQFPRFMEHVRDVEIQGAHSKWRVDGPAGQNIEFVSRVTRLVPDRVLAWHTLPDQPIEHEGTVRFDEVADGTRVHVTMRYHPPGGLVGHAVAHLLGWDPKRRLDDDLVRMKALLEDGHTRAHGQRVSIVDVQ
jgi:uncharacterized membrane protein